MGITEVTVPKQYVLVQATEPTGAFEGQLWFKPTGRLTYIYQNDEWKLITLDISQEVEELYTEIIKQELAIIELQANTEVTPIDHDTLLCDTFSDADGYKDSVDTENTTAKFNVGLYQRNNELPSLIHNWNFNEVSGNLIDQIGDNDGTLIGNKITQGETGQVDKSYLFESVANDDAYISVGQMDTLNGKGTICALVKIPSGGGGTLITSYTDANNYWRIQISTADQKPAFIVRVGSDQTYTTYTGANAVPIGEWFSLIFVFDRALNYANKCKILINDVETTVTQSTPIQPSFSFTNRTNTLIGKAEISSSCFKGNIDEIAVLNNVITIQEKTDLLECWDQGISTINIGKPKIITIDLPTITGGVLNTQLIVNGTIETGASIKYKLYDDTENTEELDLNTKNQYSLTNNPEKMEIILNPKETEPTIGNPSIKSYCLKIWKSGGD